MPSGCHPQVRKSLCLSVLFDDDLRVRLRAMTFQGLGSNILAKGIWKVIQHRRLSCHMDSKCLHKIKLVQYQYKLAAVTGAVLAWMVTSKLCGVLKFG